MRADVTAFALPDRMARGDLGAGEDHLPVAPRGRLEGHVEAIDEPRHVGGEEARQGLRGGDRVGIGAQGLLVEGERLGLGLGLGILGEEGGGADHVGGALARLLGQPGEGELALDEARAIAQALGEPLQPAGGEDALRPEGQGFAVTRQGGAQGRGVVGGVGLDQHRLLDVVDGPGDRVAGELPAGLDGGHQAGPGGDGGGVGDGDAGGELARDPDGGVERRGVVGGLAREAAEGLRGGARAELLLERAELPERAGAGQAGGEHVGLGAEHAPQRGVRPHRSVELLQHAQRRHVARHHGDQALEHGHRLLGALLGVDGGERHPELVVERGRRLPLDPAGVEVGERGAVAAAQVDALHGFEQGRVVLDAGQPVGLGEADLEGRGVVAHHHLLQFLGGLEQVARVLHGVGGRRRPGSMSASTSFWGLCSARRRRATSSAGRGWRGLMRAASA